MVRVGQIGVGKMGLSHLAIANTHPDAELVGVCDNASLLLDGLRRFAGFKTFSDYRKMLDRERLDAIIVATPTSLHEEIVKAALDRSISVFYEKPFCLNAEHGRSLAALAVERGLVNQVGYHARFLASFQEAKLILESGVLGRLHHIKAEAYGAVVLRPKGGTWRARRKEGGGCLYDYASHAIDLVNFLVGAPVAVSGTMLPSIYSSGVEDAVYSNLVFAGGLTGQIEANWSDPSYRKMTLRVSIWGSNGRMDADRQQVQTYLRNDSGGRHGHTQGWNTRYTTDLTLPMWYYLRGEEYSAQIDYFIRRVKDRNLENISSFEDASKTDQVMAQMAADHAAGPTLPHGRSAEPAVALAQPAPTTRFRERWAARGRG